jgi:hypothetical protein
MDPEPDRRFPSPIVNIAQPDIGTGLHMQASSLPWVVTLGTYRFVGRMVEFLVLLFEGRHPVSDWLRGPNFGGP